MNFQKYTSPKYFIFCFLMESQFLHLPILLSFTFLVFIALKIGERFKPTPKLPPGPWKLPFIGNLHQLIGSQLHRALGDLAAKHGPLMYLRLGEVPTLVISSAEYAKEDIFAAGSETSATVVDWAMVEMMKNQEVLRKAQAEVRRVFDHRGSVDEAGIAGLKYLRLVIKETLRLHPPVPMLLPRETTHKCDINGYEIPAKTRVFVNAWAIGRDPKYWVDAERYYPARFLDNPIDFKGSNFEYLPFGAGRRICPGMTFGIAIVELSLSQLLYHFDWKLPDGMSPADIDMREDFGLAARKRDPLYLIPSPYHTSLATTLNYETHL